MTIVFGVDVAFTNDKTVVAIRDDIFIHPLITVNSNDPKTTADIIYELYERYNPKIINVDTIGIGISIVSWLRHLKLPVYAVDVRTSKKGGKFKNRRAELYWDLRQRINPANIAIWKKNPRDKQTIKPLYLPKDSELLSELSCITFNYGDTDNKLSIESKLSIRDKLGRSPDKADAVVYSLPEDGLTHTQLQVCDLNNFRLPQSSKWKL